MIIERRLGIDTGGTFTDFVYYDGERIHIHKVLSTPDAPERAILQGIREMNIELHGLRIIHGSTIATNAVLEGKGARHRLYHQSWFEGCLEYRPTGTARTI